MTHIAPADLRAQKLAQAAKAIATVLQEEFQSVFRVLDTTTATLLWPQTSSPTERAVVALTDVEEFRQLAQSHQVQVTVLPQGDFRLRLPMSLSGGITLIAEGVIKALATTASGAADEQTRLQRWAQAVLERLGQADQLRTRRFVEDDLKLQLKTAWELNLTVDRLLRHLRIHRDMTTNLDQILKAALPFVGAQALIWVPQKLDGVVTCGEPVLSDDDARDLAKALRKSTDLRDTGLLLCKDGEQAAWGSSAAKLASLMVMIVPSSQTFGWLIAVNKSRNGAAENFRNSDAASMAPFAGLSYETIGSQGTAVAS